jgi:aminopeptidase N
MKHKIILSVLCAWCLVCSCNKELNVYPTTSEVDGNVIVDTKSASTVLNGVYYRFANAGVDNNSVPTILWLKVNEIFPSELANTLNSQRPRPLPIYGIMATTWLTLPMVL